MATTVWVMACKVPQNVSGTTLLEECAVANRVQVQTTTEILSGLATQAEFDYVFFSSAFFVAFSMTVGLWLAAKNIGLILSFIRRG